MAKTVTIDLFTLAELKEQHPDGYERVHERWKRIASQDIPWGDETMESLKAVVKACGATLRDWSIGPYAYSSLRVNVANEWEDDDGNEHPIDSDWFLQNVLNPLGYVNNAGEADFPGHCKFTGYCADDDFMEAVWKGLVAGETLEDALEGLADVARRLAEADVEQAESEESMEASWDHRLFTADGEDDPR